MADLEQFMSYLDEVAEKVVESPAIKQLQKPEDYMWLLASLMGRSVVQKKSVISNDPKYRFLLHKMGKSQYLPES
jgi:hypothetical protein